MLEKLPKGVRAFIYSYMSLNALMNKISKLSKIERELISESSVLNWMPDDKIPLSHQEEIHHMKKLLLKFHHPKNYYIQYEIGYQMPKDRWETHQHDWEQIQ